MLSQLLLPLASAGFCSRMKLLLGIALLAYMASVWGNFVNIRSIQETWDLRLESRIEETEPLREKIRDLEKSFTQKYPPVKFLSEKDHKRILVTRGGWHSTLILRQRKEFCSRLCDVSSNVQFFQGLVFRCKFDFEMFLFAITIKDI
uniref:UDP-glucuronate decarboxylase N-terminal domain-containing protein n=1 Tax=Moschus moschiferus TaxID=68415 RepID=A0A8C6E3W6_MOSMO